MTPEDPTGDLVGGYRLGMSESGSDERPPRTSEPSRSARPVPVRRAPKFGAFITAGIVVGAVIGGLLGAVAPGGLLDNRTPAIVISAIGLGGLGALVAAGLAAWADHRSGRRSPPR